MGSEVSGQDGRGAAADLADVQSGGWHERRLAGDHPTTCYALLSVHMYVNGLGTLYSVPTRPYCSKQGRDDAFLKDFSRNVAI